MGVVFIKKLRAEHLKKLEWLKKKRFGSEELNMAAVFNLSHLELSRVQLEILSRGPRFGLPPSQVARDEIFSEFELYFSQMRPLLPDPELPGGKDKVEKLKARLTSLAHEYAEVEQDRLKFPLGKDHLEALHELRRNKDIIITRPDKGAGTVIMNREDYIDKMMTILEDRSKFQWLGNCDDNDKTGLQERALQAFLLRQCKEGEISQEIYERIRPSGSVRPRMYGLPKVHKADPIPLRPILSMVGSAHHEMARWLAEVLQPVLTQYSSNCVKDSFRFCEDLREYGPIEHDAFLCSFDVVSLFTNVPIDETVQICLDTLYRSNLNPPGIREGLLKKLLFKATRDVEFSFNDNMYRQIDGVAMGSPLGPVLANIFLGYYESRIPDDRWPYMYRRFVDDTFSVVGCRNEAVRFMECLNSLHPALRFTMESEEDGRLPFMDVLVRREETGFTTAVYRKPTFTGLYTRWDSYCPTSQKVAVIRSLTHRAKRICSPIYLSNEIEKLKSIFEKNGYPTPIVERIIQQTLQVESNPSVLPEKLEKICIRLPWLGAASTVLGKRICRITSEAIPHCKPVCVFTTRRMLPTCKKDVLPADKLSNLIYLFDCVCGHSYVGKTTQRLEERVKQHVSSEVMAAVAGSGCAVRKPGRPKKADGVMKQAPTREVIGTSSVRVLRSMVRSTPGVATPETLCRDTATSSVPTRSDDAHGKAPQLKVRRGDSAILKHLKSSLKCRQEVCVDAMKQFKILARGRSEVHLSILEALFIARHKPTLCAQKEHVRILELF